MGSFLTLLYVLTQLGVAGGHVHPIADCLSFFFCLWLYVVLNELDLNKYLRIALAYMCTVGILFYIQEHIYYLDIWAPAVKLGLFVAFLRLLWKDISIKAVAILYLLSLIPLVIFSFFFAWAYAQAWGM